MEQTDFNDPDTTLARANLALHEARLAHEVQKLNKAREAAGLPPVHVDVVVQASASSTDRAPELQRDPREVADILRNVLGSIEFTAKAIAMAEAVDGYRFAESTQLSDSGFVQERVAMLWCIGVLDGGIGGAAPVRWRIPAYYKASS